uniref:Uncharacterized protein n=1 Tax=Arundo donax TaxID=35708 RepID=A0A0A8ZQT4_ARUDO
MFNNHPATSLGSRDKLLPHLSAMRPPAMAPMSIPAKTTLLMRPCSAPDTAHFASTAGPTKESSMISNAYATQPRPE